MFRSAPLRRLGSTAAVFLALAVCGCSQAPKDDRITLRYMAWGNPEQLQVEREIADEFEKRHPHIRVHLFMVPGNAYQDKLQLMLASRTAPDVLRVDHYYFPALVPKGYFRSLDEFIAREPAGFLDDYLPLSLEEGRWNGKLYGLNVLFGCVMLYYNEDLIRAAGLEDPYELNRRKQWDWARFVRHAQALTKRDSSDRPVQFGTNSPTFPMFASVIWNHGGEFLDSGMGRMIMADDEGSRLGLQEFADLRWRYKCAPTPADTALSAFTFESGKIAMAWGWAGESPRYRRNIKSFKWDVVPTPSGPAGNWTVVKGNQLCIHQETEHPKEAWEFVKFMTGPDAEQILGGRLRRSIPTRKSVLASAEYLKADQPPYHTDSFLESLRRGKTLPIDRRYQEWSQSFIAALEPLVNVQEADAQSALKDASARVNRVLSGEEGF